MTTGLPCERCVGRSLNLCKPLDDARLKVMIGLGGIRRWKKREMLFRAGDPMGAFFKIRSGVVAVSRTLDDGRRQIVAVRVTGDCVGYLHVDGRYAFEGEALTEVEACAFNRRRFDAFAAQHPDLTAAVRETLSAALRQSGQAMLVLGKLKSTERVAHFLAEIDTLYQQRHISSRPLSLKMSSRRDRRLPRSHHRDGEPSHRQAEEAQRHRPHGQRRGRGPRQRPAAPDRQGRSRLRQCGGGHR